MSSFSISPAVSGKSTWNLASDGPLDLSTSGTWTIVPSANVDVGAKVWGAGGGHSYNTGGGGGAATGNITLVSGTSYQLIVGSGGAGTTSPNRNGGGGGAGSGIQFTSGSVAILVAGGGGGGCSGQGGAGGGTNGQAGSPAQGPGQGGTQSAPGAGGAGGRRTGSAGSGRNGGNGAGDSGSLSGGTGFGNGGTGFYHGGDAGGGGGGGGYFGGGGGGGEAGGGAGGGGSGYINTSVVTSGNLYTGNYEVPGSNTDANRGTAGNGGISTSVTGNAGKIYLSLNIPPDGFNNVPTSVTSGTTITISLGSLANSTATPPGTVSYTITGVSSDDLMGTALTGNMTLVGYTYTLSIPTKIKASTTNTLNFSAAGYSTSITINPGLIARYLIVAGGGGGGSDMGGGGGAGGYLAGSNFVITPGSKTITIGAGGSGAPAGTSGPRGTNGQDTTALGFTAIGGGGGASKHDANSFPAGNGGSGGGGSGARQSNGNYGGLAGTGTAGQGFDGANSGVTWYPGGGGGSGAAATQTGSQVAHGGVGTQNDITGTNLYWAAGGGGAGYSTYGGNGGLGGGGGGAPREGAGTTNGTGGGSALNAGSNAEIGALNSQTNKRGGAAGVNTGSGGGGGSHYNATNDGGNGGSGIVVIRYPGTPKATGGTITTVGSDTVHTFLTSGTFVAYTPGLSASQSTAYWGDTITFTSYTDNADGTNLAYTITGVTSSEINNAATSGNVTVTNSIATLTIQLSNLNYTNITTMVVTVGAQSISIPVTYVTSVVASGTGMSWGLSRTITVGTRGLANSSNIAYSMTGATTAQLAGGALSGNVQVVETIQITSRGQYSVFFDGTGDYLTVPANAAFDFGTNDYTIEGWINVSTTSWTLYATGGSGSSDQFVCDGGTLYWGFGGSFGGGTASYFTSADLNIWTHVAVSRSSGTTRIFKNGAVMATSSTVAAIGSSANTLQIGRRSDGFYHTTGWMSNIRVLKGTGLYTSTFTPPTSGLAAITNTVLLVCASSTLRDLSTNNFTISRFGDAVVSVNNPVPTTFSNFFDGTGDFLTATYSINWSTFGSYTLEFWVFHTSMTPANQAYASTGSTGFTNFYNYADGRVGVGIQGTNEITSAAGAIIINQWQHVAYTYNGTTTKIYVNGTEVASGTTGVYSNNSGNLVIGSGLGSLPVFGFINDFRLVQGTAVYTAAFTPPTAPLTAITNTRLLTCQSNAYRDNSSNNYTLTRSGDVAIRSFNPIEFTYSNFFDGTGDYLSFTNSTAMTLGTGDFTVEAWVYPTALPGVSTNWWNILDCRGSAAAAPWIFGMRMVSSQLKNTFYTGSEYQSTANVPLNTWTHLSWTRQGSTLRGFINGTLDTTVSNVTTNLTASGTAYIGTLIDGWMATGYISNLRVVVGTALYTSTFTVPTTALTAVSGTALLTCRSNRFIDLSTNNITLTRFGDVRVDAFIPDIAFVPAVSSSIGTAVLTINTNASEPILNTATLVVTIAGTTRTFLLKTTGPGNIIERLTSSIPNLEFIDTEITDVHTANLEPIVSTAANMSTFVDTKKFDSTFSNITYAATYAHTTGTDVRISGGGTAGSNQRWSI